MDDRTRPDLKDPIPDDVQTQIIEFLPPILKRAIQSYERFISARDQLTRGQNEADRFRKYHVACRAAISHIELMVKLADRLQMLKKSELSANPKISVFLQTLERARSDVLEYAAIQQIEAEKDGITK